MLYEGPLVAFTVLAQTAVGAHLTVNLFDRFKKPGVADARLYIARFAILVFMGVGFLFSTTHLGSPLRAFNALNRVGSAALSNEILTGAGFLSLAGLYWLMSVMKIGNDSVRKAVNLLSIAVGVVFMFAMAKVYLIQTVPAWFTPMTTLAFWFTVLTSGVLFGYTLLTVLDITVESVNRRLMWTGLTLIGLNVAFVVMHVLYFAGISTAIHSGLAQITQLSGYVAGHVLLLVAAGALWRYAELFAQTPRQKNRLVVVAFIVLFVAELLGRNVFYGMHFTSGLY
ncbi:anaerobic dimethyl sulfoxide reductase chain C [Photobacterium aphoticum]|uniref:Anaerobic dimethyl sulfoxide reductase chain C n=1 Tax=Photobacterium aphoticum TaxID=754436 RepID=A0A090QTQ7_9GAMM|nr:anaerobic dimethyl sulfoxide reductase chain C [Photobacterium aphoticum]